jgi:hypothetical protein
MSNVNVEKRKAELFTLFTELEMDTVVLRRVLREARSDLVRVQTADDAVEFDEKYLDLEANLKHIRLF